MGQQATAQTVLQSITNAGTVVVSAKAVVAADGSTGVTAHHPATGWAFVTASAVGVGQVAEGGAASQIITNSGIISVDVKATATAPEGGPTLTAIADGIGSPAAFAFGVQQVNSATATAAQTFINDGILKVHAVASGHAGDGSGSAVARGYDAIAGGNTSPERQYL